MTVAIAVVLALGALFYTLFVRPRDVPEPLPVSPIQHLEDRKYAIYDNLRDLQFEYRLGKLSDEDYQQTKQALQRELAVVLAEIEKTAPPKRKKPDGRVCPHCNASFPRPLKFCGECGKAMA
jgi:hypothetical protein